MTPRKPARRPASTTPIYDRSANRSLRAGLFKLVLLVGVPLLLLSLYGQPALRFEYTWYGNENARTHTRCVYLALDGWHVIRPPYGFNQCPIIKLLPIDLMNFLLG
ncbi:amino acid transporter [Nitratireductor alexandrii]|uniref:amino acid transporter n=1 Tax=Nitratireductor alexandrii TaxID=2448161 RepID=UPI000FDC1D92|nr:amino acid transporter [Nitratireductor alexandrii]